MDQDMVPIGRSNIPEMMFGLNFGAEWRGFDFSMLLQGAALFDVNLCGIYPNYIRDDTFYTRPFYVDGNTPYYLVEGSWRPDNTDAKYPRLGVNMRSNGGKLSSWWVKDGTYVRLKNIQLGYSLPEKIVRKAGLTKIRAYFSGGNLLTLSHLDHLDPEMPSVNQGYYPQQRTYEFGLNLSFLISPTMKKINKIYAVMAAAGLLLGSCNVDPELTSSYPEDTYMVQLRPIFSCISTVSIRSSPATIPLQKKAALIF